MKVLLKKIAEQADRRLPTRSRSLAQDLPAFKGFLRLESERLRMSHRSGAAGYDTVQARSFLVDLIVRKAFDLVSTEASGTGSPSSNLAVIALGGYGRGELAPFSDIDLLFLHTKSADSRPHQAIQYLLYLLWDLGLTVGHCYRTVEECVDLAKRDMVSRNALAEARFLTGYRVLFDQLGQRLCSTWFGAKRTKRYLREIEAGLLDRHARFESPTSEGEPNIKEGAGGLRDIHTVLWLSHAAFGCRRLSDLVAQGRISDRSLERAWAAYDFLLRVRNELHFQAGRRNDCLALEVQASIAAGLGYSPRNGRLASELMMHDYYSSSHRVRAFTLQLLEQIGPCPSRRSLPGYFAKKQVRGGFEIRSGQVHRLLPESGRAVRETHPLWILRAFAVAQETKASLSPEMRREVLGELSAIDRTFRALPQASHIFQAILQTNGAVAVTLRSMHATGFLARFLPEFGRSRFRVSRHWKSQCTVAEHCLSAVEQLERLVDQGMPIMTSRCDGRPVAAKESACLVLALLIKHAAAPPGIADGLQPVAATVGKRLGLDLESRTTLQFLLENGPLMSRLAETRDFREDGVLAEFSRRVGDSHRLKLLLLFVLAEVTAEPRREGPWGKSLLTGLYERSLALLARPTDGLTESLDEGCRKHLRLMPEHYARHVTAERVRSHVSLIDALSHDDMAVEWQTSETAQHTELAICTRDFPGLFARLAGTLTAQELDILDAQLFTRNDGLALDLFRVRRSWTGGPVSPEAAQGIGRALREAVQPDSDVEQEVAKWRSGQRHSLRRRPAMAEIRPSVRFDSGTSGYSTIIEVRAEDRPGLAYLIARTLEQMGIDIQFARITTEKHYALDVFYVTGSQGAKLTSAEVKTAAKHLLAALEKTED